jgi:hypothetical protein
MNLFNRYKILFIFLILFICAIFISKKYENFEQVKIKLKQNPINLNLYNNVSNGGCNNTPDVIVPVYAPWKTYWPAESIYPYYPYYPYYYNNYF